jgi:hypothetical protein
MGPNSCRGVLAFYTLDLLDGESGQGPLVLGTGNALRSNVSADVDDGSPDGGSPLTARQVLGRHRLGGSAQKPEKSNGNQAGEQLVLPRVLEPSRMRFHAALDLRGVL